MGLGNLSDLLIVAPLKDQQKYKKRLVRQIRDLVTGYAPVLRKRLLVNCVNSVGKNILLRVEKKSGMET